MWGCICLTTAFKSIVWIQNEHHLERWVCSCYLIPVHSLRLLYQPNKWVEWQGLWGEIILGWLPEVLESYEKCLKWIFMMLRHIMDSHGLCNWYSQPTPRSLHNSYSSQCWPMLRFLLISYVGQWLAWLMCFNTKMHAQHEEGQTGWSWSAPNM